MENGRVDVSGKSVLREVRIGANIDAGYRHILLDELKDKPIRVYEMEPVSAYEHKWKQLTTRRAIRSRFLNVWPRRANRIAFVATWALIG